MFHCLPSQPDAFRGRGIESRGGFKADKAAARVDGGHGGGGGASADVGNDLPGPGIGLDEILAQLHGFLGGMDGALYGRKGQPIYMKICMLFHCYDATI